MASTKSESQTSEIEKQLSILVAAGTGVIAKPHENPVKALSHIIQLGIQNKLLEGLKDSFNFLVKEGKIDEEYLTSSKGYRTCQEIIKSLEDEYIDETKFNALKSIFIKAAIDNEKDERSEALILQFMSITCMLNITQITILKAVYDISNEEDFSDPSIHLPAQKWLSMVANKSNLTHIAIVENEEEALMNMRLISQRLNSDRSGVAFRPNFRLTTLGYDLCGYLAYEI